ncbi:inositol monophosphatase [Longispora sp. NPDC051575]|uniref:inositol monophosphatase family protein n=1 Tax=Longispora sp. NPDC051575 TaxID=3154943 RepID=UPI003415FFD1
MDTRTNADLLVLLPHVVDAVTTAATHLTSNFSPDLRSPATRDGIIAGFAALDTPVEEHLRRELTRLRPTAGWDGDEFGTAPLPPGEFWVVDPVDGVVHYTHGLPYWSVSVALVRDGVPVLAVVHAPPLGRTYTAVAGHGATVDGAPSAKTEPGAALSATSLGSDPAGDPESTRRAGLSLAAVAPHVLVVRNLGPTSVQVADVAAGRLDAFWLYGRTRDLLTGALLVREAGGTVTDTAGRPWTDRSDSFLATAPGLHQGFVSLLSTVDAPPTTSA